VRRIVLLCVLLGAILFGWYRWHGRPSGEPPGETSGPTIVKQPPTFAQRTFDPAMPPADMPPMRPGESAECDSNFLSSASVGGETRQTDATHATVTVTRINVTLQLNVTIWTPPGASQHVIDHEEGHRQISEYYYQAADKVAERIAARYMGKQIDIAGENSDAESTKSLRQMAGEIAAEYNKQLNPEPAQLLYDDITDHSRNEVLVKDAVDHALKNVSIERE
jgi:hypothetical protein